MSTDNEIQKELEEISPVLSRIPRTNSYSPPPPGYFDELPAAMLSKVKQAKVISIAPKQNIWRIAAAAVLAGGVIVGGWFFVQNRSSIADTSALASVQTQMKQVSDTEMSAYVEGNNILPAYDTASTAPLTGEDVPLVLADVTDQELQQYIDQEDLSPKLN